MGDEPCSKTSEDLLGIERDIWIEEKIEQLRVDFFAAIAAGEDEHAHELVDRFEASLSRLSPRLRHEVISETTVLLGDELKARRESRGDAGSD